MNERSTEYGWNVTKAGKPIDGKALAKLKLPEDEDECIPVPGADRFLDDALYLETDPNATHTFVSLGDLQPKRFPAEPKHLAQLIKDWLEPKGLTIEYGVIFTER